MNNINSFNFYRDYYNLIDTMQNKDKRDLLVAIVDYVFKDIEPDLIDHNKAIFNTLKHQLDVSKNNSKRRNRKETELITGTKPEENRNETEKKPKRNQKETREKQNSISTFLFLISNLIKEDRGLLRGKMEEWLNYKTERNEVYKETGFKTLLSKVVKEADEFGDKAVVDLIDECMANNWKGIIWEKLNTKEKVPSWYGEEVKKQEMTSDELKELENILSEFE